MKILLADDQYLVRECLRAMLEREGMEVVAEADDGRAAVDLAEKLRPDIAVLDLAMPVLNGINATREILRVSPRTRTILLTGHAEDHYVVEAVHAGVRGYMLKSTAACDLVRAINEAAAGQLYLSPDVSEAVVQALVRHDEPPLDPLSARERQVLQLVAEGKSTKEVATILGIAVKTADSHRTRLMKKLDIHETASLVRYAIRTGVIQP